MLSHRVFCRKSEWCNWPVFEIRWLRGTMSVHQRTWGKVILKLEVLRIWHQDIYTISTSCICNTCFLGKYWCQVINTAADPDQPLMRSNVFTLLAPENYIRMKYSGDLQLQVMPNRTCTDHLSAQSSTSGLIANLLWYWYWKEEDKRESCTFSQQLHRSKQQHVYCVLKCIQWLLLVQFLCRWLQYHT